MEDNSNRIYVTMPVSILPEDRARIERMARAQGLSVSAQIRMLVLPQLTAWEQEKAAQPTEQQ
jgi:uncharacterized protein (DUF2252 family)